jgi:peptide/nickel transport system permease protein
MTTLVAKRLLSSVVILFCLTAAMFVLQKISKIDPVHAILGVNASQHAINIERAKLGLDKPFFTQFWSYVGGLLHGNFGISYSTRRPVSTDIGSFLPATLELALFGLVVAIVLAVLLTVATTLHWFGSKVFRFLLLLGGSTPPFFIAIVGIVLFYKDLGILPATGETSYAVVPNGPTHLLVLDALLHGNVGLCANALQHLLLPGLAIAIGPAVSIGRVLRSSVLISSQQDFVRTARAKGMSELRILLKHVVRNASGPALSVVGLQMGRMFAGVLVVESIFAWPGLGEYMAQSLAVDDFPAIAGVTLVLGIGYILINTIVDIVQYLADPRIRV